MNQRQAWVALIQWSKLIEPQSTTKSPQPRFLDASFRIIYLATTSMIRRRNQSFRTFQQELTNKTIKSALTKKDNNTERARLLRFLNSSRRRPELLDVLKSNQRLKVRKEERSWFWKEDRIASLKTPRSRSLIETRTKMSSLTDKKGITQDLTKKILSMKGKGRGETKTMTMRTSRSYSQMLI